MTQLPTVLDFTTRLRSAIASAGGVRRFSIILNRNPSTVYRWLQNNRAPGFDSFHALASAGVDVNYLLTGHPAPIGETPHGTSNTPGSR